MRRCAALYHADHPAGGMRLNMIKILSKPSNQLVQTFNYQWWLINHIFLCFRDRQTLTFVSTFLQQATARMVRTKYCYRSYKGAQTPALSYTSGVSKCMGALQTAHLTLNIVYINTSILLTIGIIYIDSQFSTSPSRIKIQLLFQLHFYIHTQILSTP